MEYIEGLNLSIAYIEDNLFEEIDYERAARIAGMSSLNKEPCKCQ